MTLGVEDGNNEWMNEVRILKTWMFWVSLWWWWKEGASKVHKHSPFSWTPSLAYPDRLGVASSMLIPASSSAIREVDYKLQGWVKSELSSIWYAKQRSSRLPTQDDKHTTVDLRCTPNQREKYSCRLGSGLIFWAACKLLIRFWLHDWCLQGYSHIWMEYAQWSE